MFFSLHDWLLIQFVVSAINGGGGIHNGRNDIRNGRNDIRNGRNDINTVNAYIVVVDIVSANPKVPNHTWERGLTVKYWENVNWCSIYFILSKRYIQASSVCKSIKCLIDMPKHMRTNMVLILEAASPEDVGNP